MPLCGLEWACLWQDSLDTKSGRTLSQTLKLWLYAEVLRPQNSVQSVLFWPWFFFEELCKLGTLPKKQAIFTVSLKNITAETSPRFHFVRPRSFLILYLADSADSRQWAGWIGFGTAEAGSESSLDPGKTGTTGNLLRTKKVIIILETEKH